MGLDVLIRGGWIADGTGSPPFLGDVAVVDGRIEEVGRLAPEATAARVIDAAGKIVCPGFVDPHSHSDFSLLTNPTAESTIRQGVTTEIVGNCGWSYAPVTDRSREYMSSRLLTFGYDGPVIPWSTFGEHLEFLSGVGHTPNLAWFVGHNAIRLAAGVSGSEPSEEELRSMEGFVREAMAEGALGMSTGLEFNPGREATTEELVRLNAVAGEYGGMYTSHVRNRDSAIFEAIGEFLVVAGAGGGKAEISHFNVRHNTNAPDRGWERAVAMMVDARERGLDVLADTTPFREGFGQLSGILPAWVAADGPEAALARLRDPQQRAVIRRDCDRYWRFIAKGEWERVRLQESPLHPELDGLDFRQIAELRNADPWDCFFDVLCDAGTAYESVLVVGTLFTDEHLAEMISHPLFSLGVDTFTATLDGPLAELVRHPLSYAGHVHYLTHHVREKGTLRLEEAIRKMTSMPAVHFGLWDRGLLRAGYAADVVVFDFDELDDVSTIDDPHRYAKGVEHVIVNGVAVVSNGEHTGARPGRHLLRR
ncbi:MAG: D-aminoacylase [Thermoleophilia bacterium]|nr:D-aminoacylase [Thermoleophilia bacterium]MDH5333893.1 D-aminoacylase [Thermoleophilia bacterium]